MKKPAVSAVIPVFNEEEGVGQVIDGLRKTLESSTSSHEILVVDDGSTDGSASIARAHGAKVITHPVNRGYGRSLQTGLSQVRHDLVLIIDGDGSYPPDEAAKLIERAPDFDLVVGARQGRIFWGSPMKALLRWIYLSIASYIVGEPVPDANSGLRVFKKSEQLKSVPILCHGYSFTTTMTLSFLHSGCFVDFVPVRYEARKGSSKVSPVRDILRTLQIMTQVILYYNPLKFAVTLCLIPLGGAVFFLARFIQSLEYADLALFFIGALGTLFVFILGCVLESIRLHRRIPS